MPTFRVTFGIKKVVEMDQQIVVEAKNKTEAMEKANRMIDMGTVKESGYEEIGSHFAEEQVVEVEKV